MSEVKKKTLQIRPSPHLGSGTSVDRIMFHVVLALLPTVCFAVYLFGLAALATIVTATLACVATEHIACKLRQQASTAGDYSIVITGIIYGLTLPPSLPLWITACGGVIAVLLGKLMFGGLGCNLFNPALVGRAFLQAAFPAAMTTWLPILGADRFTTLPGSTLAFPFSAPRYDVISSATPLAAMKFEHLVTDSSSLFLGMSTGSIGETSSLLILAGGLYLIARRMMRWQIPLGIFTAVILFSAIMHGLSPEQYPTPLFMLFAGGLMLGAMFMATDPVASPVTAKGCFVYGLFIGTLVVIIRFWGGLPEGVMYAILIGNACSPYIDRYIQPRPLGYGRSTS